MNKALARSQASAVIRSLGCTSFQAPIPAVKKSDRAISNQTGELVGKVGSNVLNGQRFGMRRIPRQSSAKPNAPVMNAAANDGSGRNGNGRWMGWVSQPGYGFSIKKLLLLGK
jgi:hypothetical protein